MSRLEIAEVVSGIWSIRRGRSGSASFLVKLDPGGVLIDAGADPSGAGVMQCLQKARVGLRSIRAILLTHAHAHAAGGARALRERSGARVLASPLEADELARAATSTGTRFDPDARLVDGELVEPYFRAIETPGHTRGHLAFFFEPARALFAGDAFSVVAGAPELSPGTDDADSARDSMGRCLGLEPLLLLPAHGDPLDLSARRGRGR
jgi:glyoxylase-like metal-dependent hydrolase (beta-lactamase superfamily II)